MSVRCFRRCDAGYGRMNKGRTRTAPEARPPARRVDEEAPSSALVKYGLAIPFAAPALPNPKGLPSLPASFDLRTFGRCTRCAVGFLPQLTRSDKGSPPPPPPSSRAYCFPVIPPSGIQLPTWRIVPKGCQAKLGRPIWKAGRPALARSAAASFLVLSVAHDRPRAGLH